MLKIGNFSRIAGVSIRLLHYYEEMGLFYPAYIDPHSGYRYYKTEQIKQLNKILTLKELGLTLQDIKRYVDDEVSDNELRGMLKLKRSQIYHSVEEELLRLRRIEQRLTQLDSDDVIRSEDVVIKEILAQNYVSARNHKLPMHQFADFLSTVTNVLIAQTADTPGTLTVLEHHETFPETHFDLEVGFTSPIESPIGDAALVMSGELAIVTRELPACRQAATLLHVGPWGTGMQSYLALGQWIEDHGLEVVGATREVYLEISSAPGEDNVVEFQLPVQPAERIFK